MSVNSYVQRLGHKLWFARLGRALVPVDRFIGRLTGGRLVALGLAPSLLLTTTGRRSGQPRTSPLLYAEDGGAFIVIGSNWGQGRQPAWSGNLLADPQAVVSVKGRRVPVRATLVDGADRERLRQLLLERWPAYATYEQRAAGRHLRIFRLDPVGTGMA
ncbi:MAG TPA: nitroreductase/quinone reductase family protein [Micromonosporaceae bacterium]|nr:nitroreductase/quinone reductase family protein [Micromonosporaceae bacterium]